MNWQLLNFRAPKSELAAKLAGEKIPQSVKDFIIAQAALLSASEVVVNAFGSTIEHPIEKSQALNIHAMIRGL